MNLVATLFLMLLLPQTAGQAAPAPSPTIGATPTSYLIGSQDVLTIIVFDEADLTNKYRVDSDGTISFPLVGRIPASGLTLPEFADRLTEHLSAGYIRNPQVRIEVDQYKSQSVFVIGEVRTPGKISMTGVMSLIEALAIAGSPTTTASSELIVVHPKKPKPAGTPTLPGEDKEAQTTRINIRDLQIGKAGQDIMLLDGDTIYVPKAQTFYIVGQVRNSGSFVFDPGMNVQQAIALAGGLSERGSDRGIKIRRLVDDHEKELDVRLEDKVQPNDTIILRQRFF